MNNQNKSHLELITILFGVGITIILVCLSFFYQEKIIIIFLAMIIGTLFIRYSYINTSKAFWILYVLILSMPISKNKILSYISISIGDKSISVLQILIILLSIIIFLKNKTYRSLFINKFNKVFIIYALISIIYFIIGTFKGYSSISDFSMYLFQYCLFYCVVKITNSKQDLYQLLNMTLYGLFINSIFTFIMFLTNKWSFWGIDYNGGRFGGNYLTLFIITVSYSIYLLYNKEERSNAHVSKPFLFFSIFISVILMLISQNRTNPILLVFSIVIIFIFYFFRERKRRNVILKLIILIFMSFCMIFIFKYSGLNESDFINRFKVGNVLEDRNLLTRQNTINYHLDLIIKNPLGNGLGTTLPYIDADGIKQLEDSLTIDNAYITIARKMGIIELILYMLLIFSPVYRLSKSYKIKVNNINFYFLLTYCMLIIASTLFTSQAIHSYAVSSFIWVSIGYLSVIQTNN